MYPLLNVSLEMDDLFQLYFKSGNSFFFGPTQQHIFSFELNDLKEVLFNICRVAKLKLNVFFINFVLRFYIKALGYLWKALSAGLI